MLIFYPGKYVWLGVFLYHSYRANHIKFYFPLERDFEDEKEEEETKASGSKKETVVIPDSTLEPEIQVFPFTSYSGIGPDAT